MSNFCLLLSSLFTGSLSLQRMYTHTHHTIANIRLTDSYCKSETKTVRENSSSQIASIKLRLRDQKLEKKRVITSERLNEEE